MDRPRPRPWRRRGGSVACHSSSTSVTRRARKSISAVAASHPSSPSRLPMIRTRRREKAPSLWNGVGPEVGDISMRSGYDVWLCTSLGCHAGGSIEKNQKSLVANRASKRRDRGGVWRRRLAFSYSSIYRASLGLSHSESGRSDFRPSPQYLSPVPCFPPSWCLSAGCWASRNSTPGPVSHVVGQRL